MQDTQQPDLEMIVTRQRCTSISSGNFMVKERDSIDTLDKGIRTPRVFPLRWATHMEDCASLDGV
jgi:hypothetical protein